MGDDDKPPRPPWLQVADRYLGTTEHPGHGSNPTIMGWAKVLTGWVRAYFTDDDIPWCALFLNACLDEVDLKGTNSLAAKSFASWGRDLAVPALGAILVFQRPGGHHAGFYVGESDTHYRVRGGNQSNSVNDTWLDKGRLIAIRWPKACPMPLSGRIQLAANGEPISTDEA
jgi:uncharacterized protein (TIGR02594 family)